MRKINKEKKFNKKEKNVLHHVLLVFILVFVSIILIRLFFNYYSTETSSSDLLVISLCSYIPIFIVPFFLIKWCYNEKFSDFGLCKKSKMMIFFSILLGLLTIFFAYISTILNFFSNKSVDFDLSVYPYMFYESEIYTFFALLLFFIIIPFSEELFFRGLFQTKLMSVYKKEIKIIFWNFKTGTFIALLFFVFYHLVNFFPPFSFSIFAMAYNLVFVTIIGLFFSYVYQETKSLTGPIIMHGLINGLPFFIGYIFYLYG